MNTNTTDAIDLPYVNIQDEANYFGPLDDYEIIILPIFSGRMTETEMARHGHNLGSFYGHWMLVIHEKNRLTTFYESLGNSVYLDRVRPQIIKTLSELDPKTNFNYIPFISSRAGVHHNKQIDGVSCGYHLVLYGESYMFNNGKTYLQNFEIGTEKKRLTAHLADLFFSDYATYIPRPIEGSVIIGLLCNNFF
jgi:hypothetical protein